MNEDIIVRLLQMYQSENASGWKLAGEARDEILALRAALATAQAERDDAHDALIIEKGLTQLLHADITRLQQQRDAAILRAEQAEAALAQAQAERDEAKALIAKLEGEKP